MDWSWGFLWEALEYLLGILACDCLGRLGWFGTVVCKEQEAQIAELRVQGDTQPSRATC